MERKLTGDDIKKIRTGMKLSQQAFAEHVGVLDKSTISRYENGEHYPRKRTQRAIVAFAETHLLKEAISQTTCLEA